MDFEGAVRANTNDAMSRKQIVDLIKERVKEKLGRKYPVGRIIWLYSDMYPRLFLPGYWREVGACFLRCTKDGQQSWVEGGSDFVTLGAENAPKHRHKFPLTIRNGGRRYISFDYAFMQEAKSLITTSFDDGYLPTDRFSGDASIEWGDRTAPKRWETHPHLTMPRYVNAVAWYRYS